MSEAWKNVIPEFAKFAQAEKVAEKKRRQNEIISGVIMQMSLNLSPDVYADETQYAESRNPMKAAFAGIAARFSGMAESPQSAHTKGTSAGTSASARGKE